MKWLIYGIGLLVSASILTALRTFGLDSALGGIGTAVFTVLLFFFFVYFFPRRIIRRVEANRAGKSAPVPSVDVPADAISTVQEVPQQIIADAAAPSERKRIPIHRDVVGYQFAVFILGAFLVLTALSYFSSRSTEEELRAELESVSHDRYEEGYSDAESIAYDNGYDAGISENAFASYSEGKAAGYSEGFNELYPEWLFFHTGACIVTSEGYRYHHYGCCHIEGREYWIYNTELAESKGYSPCLGCWQNQSLLFP